ncbi:MAG: hypothetical protein ACRDF4_05940 [Rhabdochlamydiaceae bacterium]
MKKLLLVFTISALSILLGIATGNIKPAKAMPAGCSTFTIDNISTDSLGVITVSDGTGDNAYLDVTGSGEYQPQEGTLKQICFVASTATIAGANVPYPNSAKIPLPNGDVVQATWQSPSLIEVVDDVISNTPIQ